MRKLLIGFIIMLSPIFASAAVIVGVQSTGSAGYMTVTWSALAKNDTGSLSNAGVWRNIKTVQIVVTAAGEQNLTIQGSMDNVTWYTLHAIELSSGVYLALTSITASTMVTIIENPLFIRPLISNESGATAVDIDVIIGANTR